MAKPVKPPKHSGYRTTKAQGMGYYIPDSMTNAQWVKIKQKWDQKLNDSGFSDIEMFSSDYTGHFLPLFSQNSIEKNQKLQKGAIGDGIAGYFDYCSTFYEHVDWRAKFNYGRYNRAWALMRELFRLHKDGVSFGDVAKALRGERSSYMKRFNIEPVYVRYRQKRSKYWCFTQLSAVLEQMWLWHATHALGSLTPYDLQHMEATGITDAVRAEALRRGKAAVED